MTASDWLRRLESPDGGTSSKLARAYGAGRGLMRERISHIRAVISRFVERFGDNPIRVFRSPGRLNLRGMHVDTHGGYLNLMTHQREAVAVISATPDDEVTLANLNPAFPEVTFHINDQASHPAFRQDWLTFIRHPDIEESVRSQKANWGSYVKGCALSAQSRFRDAPLLGLRGAVGCDVPRGAALSSSSAVTLSVLLAILGRNEKGLSKEQLILAVRDAEWYAGSRIGVSDQGAMILGGLNELVTVALLASRLDTSTATRLSFPEDVTVLVINSYTHRSLSGPQLVAYTRNRFAYSLALEIARQTLRIEGVPESIAHSTVRLADLSPVALDPYGGVKMVYRLLQSVPESIPLSELRERYDLPNLDESYQAYFGTVPEDARPRDINLRGPLMFGIAESERARVFADTIRSGRYNDAGRLMTLGHDGDRVVDATGRTHHHDVSDAALNVLMRDSYPIELCPGAYGASSPVLDSLVDTALRAGALGASLTGAGIAGAVLALCRTEDSDRVADAIRSRMNRPDYCRLANRREPLTEDDIAESVIPNHAPSGACELVL